MASSYYTSTCAGRAAYRDQHLGNGFRLRYTNPFAIQESHRSSNFVLEGADRLRRLDPLNSRSVDSVLVPGCHCIHSKFSLLKRQV